MTDKERIETLLKALEEALEIGLFRTQWDIPNGDYKTDNERLRELETYAKSLRDEDKSNGEWREAGE